jgi:hypothetical protein
MMIRKLDIRLHFLFFMSLFCVLWFFISLALYAAAYNKKKPLTLISYSSQIDKDLVLKGILITSSSLSIIGNVIIWLHFIFGKDKFSRNLQTRMITIISIVETMRCIGFLLSLFHGRYICTIQASIIQFSSLAAVLWHSCYCSFIYVQFNVYNRSAKSVLSCEPLYHIFCWSFPIVSTGLALFYKLNGTAAPCWCWINHPILRFVFLYIPLVLVIVFNIGSQIIVSIFNCIVKWYTSGESEFDEGTSLIDSRASDLSSLITWQLRLFTLALMVTWSVGLTYRVVGLFVDYRVPYGLDVAHTLLLPLNGAFNFVAYAISTKGRVFDFILRCFSCCCGFRNSGVSVYNLSESESDVDTNNSSIHNVEENEAINTSDDIQNVTHQFRLYTKM